MYDDDTRCDSCGHAAETDCACACACCGNETAPATGTITHHVIAVRRGGRDRETVRSHASGYDARLAAAAYSTSAAGRAKFVTVQRAGDLAAQTFGFIAASNPEPDPF